jgi:alpha,alpha-trehalase
LQETRREAWKRRTGLEPDEDIRVNVGNFIGGCESGWDCNPRWESHSYLYAAPDLNALLWNLEQRLADFAEILETGEAAQWQDAADRRNALMNQFLWNDERGCYSDLQVETGAFGKVFSAAAFYPMYVGMATEEQAAATVRSLGLLEHRFGIVPCEQYDGEGRFQWAAPNVWPCLQWMVIGALERYGYHQEAKRLAKQYVDLVERVEGQTGQLWEKYNGDTGSTDVAAEYKMPPMMGWTAGIYLKCKTFLKE